MERYIEIHYSFEFLEGRLDVYLYEHTFKVDFTLPAHLSYLATVIKNEHKVITIEIENGAYDDDFCWNTFYADGLTGTALADKERTLAKEYGQNAVAVKLFTDDELINELYDDINKLKHENKLKRKNKAKRNKTK